MTHGVEQPGDGDPARNKVSTPTTTEIIAEVRSQLIGPGGAFEVVTEPVGGIGQPGPIDMLVYANRLAHLREVFAFAAAHGDATFIVYGERRITFSQFVADANRVAANLATLGVGHGDRVAVLSQNNPEWCLTFWATVNLGAILVGLNGWWNTDEILFGLSDSGAKILVADPKRLARVSGSLDGLPDLQQVVVIGRVTQTTRATQCRFAHSPICWQGDPAPPATPLAEADPAVIFYTSGTTGRPKGAISTHRGMVANLQNTVFSLTANGMVLDRLGEPSSTAPGGPRRHSSPLRCSMCPAATPPWWLVCSAG